MTERPILFSGPMVRALLAGTKTQTRRVVKATPGLIDGCHDAGTVRAWVPRCPYGQPGDRLWVRETWAVPHRYDGHGPSNIPVHDVSVHYAASEERGGLLWRPSIHMPRWASRITLEITGVRVERLQDISEADSMAEGVEKLRELVNPECTLWRSYGDDDTVACRTAKCSYRTLWEQINGPGSWEANPFVWVVEFKVVQPSPNT